jgi:hypothetical protein
MRSIAPERRRLKKASIWRTRINLPVVQILIVKKRSSCTPRSEVRPQTLFQRFHTWGMCQSCVILTRQRDVKLRAASPVSCLSAHHRTHDIFQGNGQREIFSSAKLRVLEFHTMPRPYYPAGKPGRTCTHSVPSAVSLLSFQILSESSKGLY